MVKTNLIIALTPYVINDQSDLRRVLEKKMKERREFVERFGGEERPNLESDVDYRRKRGMLEEINRAAREVEGEEKEIHDLELRDQMQEQSGPLEVPVGPGTSGPSSAPAPSPGPAGTAPPPTPAPAGNEAPTPGAPRAP